MTESEAYTVYEITQAVIFAGGLGERLKPFTETDPKPMYPINGKPFLEYLIEQLKEWGIDEVILLLGYLPDKIKNYFGNGSQWDLNIEYVDTPIEYDTQFRLKAAEEKLKDDFLMMYCDNICPVDFTRLRYEYFQNKALIQLSAYSNSDGYTADNLRIGYNGIVENYDRRRAEGDLKGVDIGYAIVSKSVLGFMTKKNDCFEAVVYPKLISEGKLFATVTEHRYYSIGSYERIGLTEQYLSDRKYIFIDRDGVMNRKPPKAEYVRKPTDFSWIEGSKDAIKKLNDAGFIVIEITNQAGIARGLMTDEDFWKVQRKIDSDLAEVGAKIDAVYYCPHGWNDNCDCRKPKPGMLFQAQKDHSIDLTKCLLIGDDERDLMAACNANMKGIIVTENYLLSDAVNDVLTGYIEEREVKTDDYI